MLDFERKEYEPRSPKPGSALPPHGPLVIAAAMFMLALGAVFNRIGAFFTGAAQRSTDASTVRSWTRAVTHFRGMTPGARLPQAKWERTLLRVGSSVLLGIGGTLMVLWMLLGLGGAVVWLATHGFGFPLLFGAVLIGTIIGTKLAQLGRFGSESERLN